MSKIKGHVDKIHVFYDGSAGLTTEQSSDIRRKIGLVGMSTVITRNVGSMKDCIIREGEPVYYYQKKTGILSKTPFPMKTPEERALKRN